MVDKDAVRRGYDDLVDVYTAERTEDARGQEILKQFLDSFADSPNVLDAGCGQGTPVLYQVSAAADAVGIDFSREQLRRAANTVPDAALVQSDMTILPFATSAFDAVVAYWSIIHIPMDDHQTVIDEFARVIRPGGRLLLCEGATQWTGANPDWLDSGVRMEWNIAGAALTREQLRNAHFTILDRWGTPSSLEADREAEDDGDSPWTFFSARLDA